MSAEAARRTRRVLMPLSLDPSRKFGSMEEQVYALAAGFRDRGSALIPVYVAPQSPEERDLYAAEGLKAEVLDLHGFDFGRLRTLLRLIKRERIEIINWNFYDGLRNPYVWWLSILAPTVRHDFTDHISRVDESHDAANSLKVRVKRFLFRRYRRIFCVSDHVMRTEGRSPNDPRFVRWHHFVNTDRFAPDPETRDRVRRELGDADRFVAVVVAYLRWEKGVDVAVKAMPALPERCVLWVVGDGAEAEPLRKLAEELGVADRVRFLGLKRDVSPFVKAADCLVCPSRWVEAAGLANIEALACGIPIVGSRIGGIPEFVIEGKTGYLVPPNEPEPLAEAVAKLANDPETREALGRRAREMALAEHSTRRRVDEILGHYTF